jgi:hypothetical protein
MTKRENVSTFPRKGKPSGGEKDLGNLNEINDELKELDDDVLTDEAEIKHPNRNVHKGEDVARFTDRDEDDDQP